MPATRFSQTMFLLTLAYLLLIGAVAHGVGGPVVRDTAVVLLAVVWAALAVGAVVELVLRDRFVRLWPAARRAALRALIPPTRLGAADHGTGLVWAPKGWQQPDGEWFRKQERAFARLTLPVALVALPVMGVEFVAPWVVPETPGLADAVRAAAAAVWVVIAVEFAFKVRAAPRPLAYAAQRWIDLLVIALPLAAFVLTHAADAPRLAAILRLGQVLAPEQLARREQQSRLQVMAAKAWSSLVALNVIARLLQRTPQKRLRAIEGELLRLDEAGEDLDRRRRELLREADEVRGGGAAGGEGQAPFAIDTPRPDPR